MLRKHIQIDRRISVLVVVAIIVVALLVRFLPQQLRVMNNQNAVDRFGLPIDTLDYVSQYLGSDFQLRYAEKATNLEPIQSWSTTAASADEIWCVAVDFNAQETTYLLMYRQNQGWTDGVRTGDLAVWNGIWEEIGCSAV